MVVGTCNVKTEDCLKFINNPTGLISYVEELVPIWARHIPSIVDNQRFYVALHLRNSLSLPYKTRMSLAEPLLKGIKIRGVMSSFTPISSILDVCDKEALIKMLEQQE